jgi:hypothetical protein
MNLTEEIQLCNLLPFCYDRQNHFDRSVAQAVHYDTAKQGPNVSATPIMAMGCRQCLPLSVVQLKGKHY